MAGEHISAAEETMNHWLAKSEPTVYGWDTFVGEGRTAWTGVRNAEARNNLRAMKLGDLVLYYHSQEGKEIVGVARVVREHYPDPTSPGDPRWLVVDLAPVRALRAPVTLATMKEDPVLKETKLVKHSRISVVPFTAEQYARVLELGG